MKALNSNNAVWVQILTGRQTEHSESSESARVDIKLMCDKGHVTKQPGEWNYSINNYHLIQRKLHKSLFTMNPQIF